MDSFTLDSQRFPARCQNMDLRSFVENAFGQYSQAINDVLTAIENKQHSLVLEESKKAGNGIVGMNGKSERRGECDRNEASVLEGSEVEEVNRAVKSRE